MLKSNKLLVAIVGLVIIFVVLLIGFSLFSGNKVSTEEALKSDVPSQLEDVIIEDVNINTGVKPIIHELAKEGDWMAVIIIYTNASDYGNNTIAIYNKSGDEYNRMYIGTGAGSKELLDAGIPQRIIEKLENTDLANKYISAIMDAPNNPRNKYPIIDYLPVNGGTYSISVGYSDESNVDSFYLSIDAASGYRNAAVSKFYDLGFDPADYKIVFTDYVNPFEEENDAK
jgi:hypothetical protein